MHDERLRIGIVTPAPPRSRKGNRVTALRWARLLRSLGYRVVVAEKYRAQRFDILFALHARRSADSVQCFHRRHPDRPIILALTGTDLYGDIRTSAPAKRSLELAWALIVLQPDGLRELPRRFRRKTHVIYQSVEPRKRRPRPIKGIFEVCVLGHLRPVKDPFRAALAVRRLPLWSRIRIHHYGAALDTRSADRAGREMKQNPRYRWFGEVPRHVALRRLARSRLLVLTSKMEGGANVVSEALALGVPVISSRIGGSIGLLGPHYAGYFPVGDTAALRCLLGRCESDPRFQSRLRQACRSKARLVVPARERRSLLRLVGRVKATSKPRRRAKAASRDR